MEQFLSVLITCATGKIPQVWLSLIIFLVDQYKSASQVLSL